MPRRHIFAAVSCCLMAVVVVAGYTHDTVGKTPVRLLFENVGERVVFDRRKHAEDYKVAYGTCHHESVEACENVQPYGACHDVDFDGSFREDHVAAFADDETTRVTCHRMGSAPAKWNHTAHIEEYGFSCTDCHHVNADTEPEPTRYTACHLDKPMGDTPNMKTAAHARCMDCHQKWFDVGMKDYTGCHPFTDNHRPSASGQPVDVNPGDADCMVCHGDVKASESIPNRMEAFHGNCMKCHEKRGKGSFREDQCNQYHMK